MKSDENMLSLLEFNEMINVYEESCHVVIDRSNIVRLMIFTMLVQFLAYKIERDSMFLDESREFSKINEVYVLSLKKRDNRSLHINDSVIRKEL
jgi:hypothetical protein